MRILFKSWPQADRYLKTSITQFRRAYGNPDGIPSQRVRNAICRGLGYSSYEEYKSTYPRGFTDAPSQPPVGELIAALAHGFRNAIGVIREAGFELACTDEDLSKSLAQEVVFSLIQGAREQKLQVEINGLCLCGSGKPLMECCLLKETEEMRRAERQSQRLTALFSDQVQAVFDDHTRNWVKEKIPALDGMIPLEAVKTSEGRKKVEALLKQMEAVANRPGFQGEPKQDWNIARRLLGLPVKAEEPESPSVVDHPDFVDLYLIFDRESSTLPFPKHTMQRYRRCIEMVAALQKQHKDQVAIFDLEEETEEGGPNRAIHMGGTPDIIDSFFQSLTESQLVERALILSPNEQILQRFSKYIEVWKVTVGLSADFQKMAAEEEEDQRASDDLHDALDAQFRARWGRRRTPSDPFLWDPDAATPQPLPDERALELLIARAKEDGAPNSAIYAMKKLGMKWIMGIKQADPDGTREKQYEEACQEYLDLVAAGKEPEI